MMAHTLSLSGRVAIVTAASREIGAAIAERLALDGAAVLMAHYGEPELAERHAAIEAQRICDPFYIASDPIL